jgi:hypothetical protein
MRAKGIGRVLNIPSSRHATSVGCGAMPMPSSISHATTAPRNFWRSAAVMLAGAAATGDGGRDQCEAGDLLLMAYVRHHNGEEDQNKRELPRYIQNRIRILSAQAEALIVEHLDAGNKARKPKAQEQDQPEAPEVA